MLGWRDVLRRCRAEADGVVQIGLIDGTGAFEGLLRGLGRLLVLVRDDEGKVVRVLRRQGGRCGELLLKGGYSESVGIGMLEAVNSLGHSAADPSPHYMLLRPPFLVLFRAEGWLCSYPVRIASSCLSLDSPFIPFA